jgi:hypothetical protein
MTFKVLIIINLVINKLTSLKKKVFTLKLNLIDLMHEKMR